MTHSRAHGLALMAVGMLVFAGTTNQMLPAEAFWPALATSCIGVLLFMRANRSALDEAEERTRRALNPEIKVRSGERLAKLQSKSDGRALEEAARLEARRSGATAAEARGAAVRSNRSNAEYPDAMEPVQPGDELVLEAIDDGSPELSLDAPLRSAAEPQRAQTDAETESDEEGFVVTNDVSFPLEQENEQEKATLAGEIAKLERLREGGILSDEEFAVAKAKLLA